MTFREMTQPDVLAFLDLVDDLGITVWLDGGWGMDAALGEQTRRHADLDIVMDARDAPTLLQHLRLRGFESVVDAETRPWKVTYADPHGRAIDLHLVEFETDGVHYGPECVFPLAALNVVGAVGARTVRCVRPGAVGASR